MLERAGDFAAVPEVLSPEFPRRICRVGAAVVVSRSLALFSNAAARADAFGPCEAPITAAAEPVADPVPAAAVPVEAAPGRW